MGRKKKDDPRDKIMAEELILALQAHVLEGGKMTATQVSAAIALLKKILPDVPGAVAAAEAAADEMIKTHEEALRELE
ncbi:MAG: hypothetical protein KGL10_08535 [Alphaproteobacteria bacterium]|nr:hypothetical protein [Alphaproteobacteria bacterium]